MNNLQRILRSVTSFTSNIIHNATRLPRNIAAGFIRVYQKTLSPDHGMFKPFFPHGYCKFWPTCSENARQEIIKHGVLRGGAKGLMQILRCNPCSKGNRTPGAN